MQAKCLRDMALITSDGRRYNFLKGKEYTFVLRNDNAVVFYDEYGEEVVYGRKEFKEDFEISKV